MNRTLSYVVLVLFVAVSIALIAARPDWVSDQNGFLLGFVNHEFLNLLGVILAITLASVANIHLEFNKIEERFGKEGLTTSRTNLKKNATWLVSLFMFGLFIVTLKPLISFHEVGQAIANTAALFVVLWHVLILVSLNQLVFAIPPHITPTAPPAPHSPPSTGRNVRP